MSMDDDLSDQSKSYLNLIQSRIEQGSEAFFFLYGISALEGEDPIIKGKALLAEPQELKNKASSSTNDSQTLSKPMESNELYCRFWEDGCFKKVVSASSKWQHEIDSRATLLSRYKHFFNYNEFSTLTEPTFFTPLPEYKYLNYANRLQVFSSLHSAKKGNALEGIKNLIEDTHLLKRHLALSDDLIYKMILINLISNNLEVIAHIKTVYQIETHLEIPPLTKAETSLEAPMAREFVMLYNAYAAIENDPQYLDSEDIQLPNWLVRLGFNLNKTANRSAEHFAKIIKLSTIPATEFTNSLQQIQLEQQPDIELDNIIGSIMNKLVAPNYVEYVARLHDLSCKIALTNHMLSDKKVAINNPYGDAKFSIQQSEDITCLDGPLKDKHNLRCLSM